MIYALGIFVWLFVATCVFTALEDDRNILPANYK